MVMMIINVHFIIIVVGRPSSTFTTTIMNSDIESRVDPTWSQLIELS